MGEDRPDGTGALGVLMKILVLLLGLLLIGVLGLLVYGVVFVGRIEARYPRVGGFVDVEAARLHYIDRLPSLADGDGGDKPAFVLLHGASANLRDMLISLVEPLSARGFRVIAFDRPGHGWSTRSDPKGHDPRVQARMIAEALDQLRIDRPILVGHSWSGSVVMAFLLQYKDQVRAGVTLGGATHPWKGPPSWYNRVALAPGVGWLFRRTAIPLAGPALLPEGIKSNFAPDRPITDYAKRAGIVMLFRPRQFLANALDSVHLKGALAEMSQDYAQVTTPLLIITGDKDRTVTPRIHSMPLHDQVAGSRLVVFDNVGHMPHHARQEAVVTELIALADRTGGAP